LSYCYAGILLVFIFSSEIFEKEGEEMRYWISVFFSFLILVSVVFITACKQNPEAIQTSTEILTAESGSEEERSPDIWQQMMGELEGEAEELEEMGQEEISQGEEQADIEKDGQGMEEYQEFPEEMIRGEEYEIGESETEAVEDTKEPDEE
jgi:hypothetical protein